MIYFISKIFNDNLSNFIVLILANNAEHAVISSEGHSLDFRYADIDGVVDGVGLWS